MFSFFVQVRAIDMHNFCVIFSSLMDHAANTKVVVSSDLFRLHSMWDSTVPINDLELSGLFKVTTSMPVQHEMPNARSSLLQVYLGH